MAGLISSTRYSPQKRQKAAHTAHAPAPPPASSLSLRGALGCIAFTAAIGSLGAVVPIIIGVRVDLDVWHRFREHDKDFQLLSGTCNVTLVRMCWHTSPDAEPPGVPGSERSGAGSPSCWRSYTASFIPPDDSRVFEAWPEYVRVDGEGACGSGCNAEDAERSGSGAFETGVAVPCWKANRTVDLRYQYAARLARLTSIFFFAERASLSRGRCNNAPCYKLSDPALLVEPAIERATSALYLGGGLAAAGILAFCLSCALSPPKEFTKEFSAPSTKEARINIAAGARRVAGGMPVAALPAGGASNLAASRV